ncbi:NAD(P)-binding protein [Rhizodiscina lignyota]|uniref:NAD(P)-binding protein n=1 Tax=Rhizodiscina lignyota TaxID=1504668 RepID=A0A9P4I803_9PEZI|nr:NAD(P)-binding protein [Rhizodiscina lignyota]
MAGVKSFVNARVVVLGGTGDQGRSVVKALAKSNEFRVSVLTRDPNSAKAQALVSEFPNVKLLEGSYTTEAGLRTAFADQDVTYFNIDTFTVGEGLEYFWTFRAYEIAIQSGLKWFIYPGSPHRFEDYGFAEKHRNSHNVVASRLSDWLATQPVEQLPWTITYGGIYVEMLSRLLRPHKEGDKVVFKAPMDNDSVVPLIPLDAYGEHIKWALRHPNESIGKRLSAGPYEVTYPQIADAFQKASGKKAEFASVSIDDWMTSISPFVDVEKNFPRGAPDSDPTTFKFRKSFTGWWNMWRDNRKDPLNEDTRWAEEDYPSRPNTLQDWMMQTKYSV